MPSSNIKRCFLFTKQYCKHTVILPQIQKSSHFNFPVMTFSSLANLKVQLVFSFVHIDLWPEKEAVTNITLLKGHDKYETDTKVDCKLLYK